MIIDRYVLKGGLNEDQIKAMHQKALDLIENEGVQVPHDGIVNILGDYAGVTVGSNNMVRFEPGLVEKALTEAKYDMPEYAKDMWIVSAGAHQTNVADLETGKLREPTTQDLIDLIRLGDALDTVGSSPVVPLDLPIHLQLLMMYKVAYEYSRYRCNDIYEHMDKPTIECANYVYEMAQVAGKRYAYGIWMISPRTFDRHALDVAYKLLDRGVAMAISTMPVAGVSSPITMIGTLLQSMFEHFFGLTMLSLINTKSFNYISPNDAFDGCPFDMKYSTFVYGSAEYVHSTLYQIPLCRHYGVPIITKTLLTASKEVDAQAAAEIGMHTLIAALFGSRAFRCGGLLSSAEYYSAEMLVVEKEIIEYVQNVLREQEFSDERLMADEIAALRPGQSFIGRRSTFENFRKEYWQPELFTHSNLGQWKEMGSKSLYQYANERAKKLIAEHDYQIDEDKKRELDRILEKAKTDEKLIDSFKF